MKISFNTGEKNTKLVNKCKYCYSDIWVTEDICPKCSKDNMDY